MPKRNKIVMSKLKGRSADQPVYFNQRLCFNNAEISVSTFILTVGSK